MAAASHGTGWGLGSFSLRLLSDPTADAIIRSTKVSGFGLRAAFTVPNAVPLLPDEWLFHDEGKFYINLPPTDNWSESDSLSTTWQKLRIQGIPGLLQNRGKIYVDLTDATYATSNGRTSLSNPGLRSHWAGAPQG